MGVYISEGWLNGSGTKAWKVHFSSLGFQSLASLMGHDTLLGIEAAFRMILVSVSLATGLLFANVILPPVPLEPASESG